MKRKAPTGEKERPLGELAEDLGSRPLPVPLSPDYWDSVRATCADCGVAVAMEDITDCPHCSYTICQGCATECPLCENKFCNYCSHDPSAVASSHVHDCIQGEMVWSSPAKLYDRRAKTCCMRPWAAPRCSCTCAGGYAERMPPARACDTCSMEAWRGRNCRTCYHWHCFFCAKGREVCEACSRTAIDVGSIDTTQASTVDSQTLAELRVTPEPTDEKESDNKWWGRASHSDRRGRGYDGARHQNQHCRHGRP